MSDCLKELEIKNKMINILQAENKVYRNEQRGWVKEIERIQAENKGYETVYKRALLENERLKKENKAYKGMWEEFKEYLDNDVANNTYDYDILDVTEHYQKQIAGLQKKYLGGGE
jgi:septum formation inhibitor-activating ATPase MinD